MTENQMIEVFVSRIRTPIGQFFYALSQMVSSIAAKFGLGEAAHQKRVDERAQQNYQAGFLRY